MLQHRNGCAPKMGLLNKITKKKNAARIKKTGKIFCPSKALRIEYYSEQLRQSLPLLSGIALQNFIECYLKRLRQSVGTEVKDWDLSDFFPNHTFCLYSLPLYL